MIDFFKLKISRKDKIAEMVKIQGVLVGRLTPGTPEHTKAVIILEQLSTQKIEIDKES